MDDAYVSSMPCMYLLGTLKRPVVLYYKQGDCMTNQELEQMVIALKAENDALKAKKSKALSWKVSEKGAISIYGFGRFPVTLYYDHLIKLNAAMPEIVKFAEVNKDKLSTKLTVVKAA